MPMTSAQYALYRAALQIGRQFGTGGPMWTYVQPSGNGVTADITLVNQGLRRVYIVRNFLDKARSALAQTPIFAADWLGIGAADLGLIPTGILISVADPGQTFSVIGAVATDQGFTLVPLAPAANPLTPAPPQLLRRGLRIGAQAGM